MNIFWIFLPDLVLPKVGEIYMIRGFYGNNESLYLEEIINKPLPITNVEPSFNKDAFEEVLEKNNEI